MCRLLIRLETSEEKPASGETINTWGEVGERHILSLWLGSKTARRDSIRQQQQQPGGGGASKSRIFHSVKWRHSWWSDLADPVRYNKIHILIESRRESGKSFVRTKSELIKSNIRLIKMFNWIECVNGKRQGLLNKIILATSWIRATASFYLKPKVSNYLKRRSCFMCCE